MRRVLLALVLTACEEEPGPGYILSEEDDQVELCVGQIEVPDPALRVLLEELLPQPDPPEGATEEPPPVILAEELRKLTGLRATNLGITDLTGLECAQRLETLGLAGNAIADLDPLRSITGIRQLELSNNRVTDLSVLEGFERLERVTLDGNGIKDLRPIARITSLQFVDLARNEISDIAPLSRLVQLRGLVLSQNKVTDVTPLRGLTELVAVELDENMIDDVSAFERLTKLRYVDLDGNAVPSVASLADATDLIQLEVSGNALTDLVGLADKPRLLDVRANENMIATTEGLRGVGALTNLELGSNRITALPGVESLFGLRRLQLADNQVTDIAAIANLPSMRDLDIRQNVGITDLSPLATLPLLGRFIAGSGQTLDLSPLRGRTVLKTVSYTDATLVGDLAFVAELPGLEGLDLSRVPLTNAMIEQIATVGTLQALTIDGCGVDQLGPLAANVNMEVLSAADNGVRAVGFMASWPNVGEVTLANNPLENLEGVELLERLALFDVSGSQIQDLVPLAANETFRQGDEVIATGTPLDGEDCAEIATIVGRNALVTVDFDCP
jgi:Leucine-rich repeat (LRR) protein